MKIGISCTGTNSSYKGGVNTYIFGLLDGFLNIGNEHKFQIYISNSDKNLYKKYLKNDNFELIRVPDNNDLSLLLRILRRITRKLSLVSLYKFISDLLSKRITAIINKNSDILYLPRTILYPYNLKIPTVVSIHDIQQFHYPQFFTKRQLKARKISYGLTVKYANYIQASSNFIKSDLLKHYPSLKYSQIPVINEGVNIDKFKIKLDCKAIRDKYNINYKYLFFPAQLWPHKNHITILKTLKLIEEENGIKIPLLLTGAKMNNSKVVFEFIHDNKMNYVHYLGKVEFEDLVCLYQYAEFMITAVLYESSSLPILESAASGTPIIASKTSPNEEMSKILRINMFDPLDYEELSKLILKLWENDKIKEMQIKHNLKNIYKYSWNCVAKEYINLFTKIVS